MERLESKILVCVPICQKESYDKTYSVPILLRSLERFQCPKGFQLSYYVIIDSDSDLKPFERLLDWLKDKDAEVEKWSSSREGLLVRYLVTAISRARCVESAAESGLSLLSGLRYFSTSGCSKTAVTTQ